MLPLCYNMQCAAHTRTPEPFSMLELPGARGLTNLQARSC